MKYAVPLGALLLIAFGVWHHRMPSVSSQPERRKTTESGMSSAMEGLRSGRPAVETSVPQGGLSQEKNPVRPAVARSEGKAPVAVLDWRKMSAVLDRSVSVSAVQMSEVEGILRKRDEEIRACHDAIRKAGVLDIRSYEWQVRRWKEDWYRSIDRLLDRSQHERFVALVEGGYFNEGLAFSIEPGITVLE